MDERIEGMDKGFKIEEDGTDVINFWKPIYYEFHDLVNKELIFSKLPLKVMLKMYYNMPTPLQEKSTNSLKGSLIIPALTLWKLFPLKIERMYYNWKYPEVSTLENLKNTDFEFLFVINTRDHIITALPVLESLDKSGKRILVVTFKGVYSKYKEEFDRFENAEIVFFEYELKNLPLRRYPHILKETKDKIEILNSYNMDKAVKAALLEDLNYIKFHIKTELIQYYFFKNIFEYFNLKGVVSIVFTTAFEIAKGKNIPTFILQHGIGGGDAWPYISDYFFAYDEVTKLNLEGLLDNTVKILPLGAPRFEYFAKSSENLKRKDFNKKISKSINMKNVTYISAGTEEFEDENIVSALKNIREKLPDDVNLIIKLHPREILKFSNIKKQIRKKFLKSELKKTVFIRKEIDFYELLVNSDIVVTMLSTGAQESIAMDIPVLQVNFTGKPYPKSYDFSTFGWKDPINDPDVMIKEVLSILNNKKRYGTVIEKQRWLKNRMFPNFCRCGKVISETILNICEDEVEK